MINIYHINNHITVGILDLTLFAAQRQLTGKRDVETRGKLFVINELIQHKNELNYNDNGKPYLINDSRHISISHSHEMLVVIMNELEETGIDIEIIRDKILNIKHKFLSVNELLDTKDDVEKLIIYWAAKETLYKIYGVLGVDFIKHLYIKPFKKDLKGIIIGTIKLPTLNATFKLHYERIKEYMLVYAIEKATC